MELNLTPEDIERLVKDSIMKSGFGKAVEDSIKRAMAPGYDNPVEKALKIYVHEATLALIRERYSDQVQAAITARLDEELTQEVVKELTSKVVNRFIAER